MQKHSTKHPRSQLQTHQCRNIRVWAELELQIVKIPQLHWLKQILYQQKATYSYSTLVVKSFQERFFVHRTLSNETSAVLGADPEEAIYDIWYARDSEEFVNHTIYWFRTVILIKGCFWSPDVVSYCTLNCVELFLFLVLKVSKWRGKSWK